MALAVMTAVDVGRTVYAHSFPEDAVKTGNVELEHSQYADTPASGFAPWKVHGMKLAVVDAGCVPEVENLAEAVFEELESTDGMLTEVPNVVEDDENIVVFSMGQYTWVKLDTIILPLTTTGKSSDDSCLFARFCEPLMSSARLSTAVIEQRSSGARL